MKKILTLMAVAMLLASCGCRQTKSVEAAPACQCDTCQCDSCTCAAADTVVLE